MMTAPATPELEQRALSLPEQARALTITDDASFGVAAEQLKGIVTLRREITEHHAPLKQAAWDSHRAIVAAEKKLLDPVAEAESIIKRAIATYTEEQQRIAAEAERQARIEAERRTEEERLAAAVEAVEQGASEAEAQAIYEMPVAVPYVAPTRSVPRIAGISTPVTYAAEALDIKLLCKSIAEGTTPAHFVTPNMTAINQQARAMRESFNVPGCRAVKGTNTRVSTGRK